MLTKLQKDGNASEQILWCADENMSPDDMADFKGIILTNRFDLYETLKSRNTPCIFNDFNLAEAFKSHPLKGMLFHIAKEKSINKHLMLSFFESFSPLNALSMFGKKQQGILSLIKFAQSLDADVEIIKHKNKYIEARIPYKNIPPEQSDYNTLIPVKDTGMVSKMGVYGYNKVDVGSLLLIEALAGMISKQSIAIHNLSLLDLGCGYGYLSVKAQELGFKMIDATDNCAGALLASQKNFQSFGIHGSVVASDCAKNISTKYNVVLSNPPFHQGFDHKKSLTEAFVSSARQHLTEKGFALFVVNQFIGIEKIAKKYFPHYTVILKESGYKVVVLSNTTL